jgi:hypothetical protein
LPLIKSSARQYPGAIEGAGDEQKQERTLNIRKVELGRKIRVDGAHKLEFGDVTRHCRAQIASMSVESNNIRCHMRSVTQRKGQRIKCSAAEPEIRIW